MSSPEPHRQPSLTSFHPGELSFTSLYLRLRNLQSALAEDPALADEPALDSLEAALAGTSHARESLAPFMYRLAAECLAGIMTDSPQPQSRRRAESILRRTACLDGHGTCLAAARALGTLPVLIPKPNEPADQPCAAPSSVSCTDLFHRIGLRPDSFSWAGRSLIAAETETRRALVLKFSGITGDLSELCREARWMELLRGEAQNIPERFEVPEVLKLTGSPVIIPQDLSEHTALPRTLAGKPCRPALAFETTLDYFGYPNDPAWLRSCSGAELVELMTRNSRLFGRLTGRGLLHTAPIPLFHNRTQQTRRDDGGVYLWQRCGRLDRWLWSCRYPNFGRTGLRDFEHFRVFEGSRQELFREAGNQVLSLSLVAASCFRYRRPDLYGLDGRGRPLDLRHLFEAPLLEALLKGIASGFYEGFVGRPMEPGLLPSLSRLCERMIEEMGVDRNMMETLRLEDQAVMDQEEFLEFLQQRGFTCHEAAAVTRGEKELEICTGPHLGSFNRGISLPELIDFTAGTAAMAIAGRYLDQLKPESSLVPALQSGAQVSAEQISR